VQDSRIVTAGSDDGLPAHFRRVVSFHPRGGRLNPVQRRALEAHAAAWYRDPDDFAGPIDLPALFGRKADFVLVLGSGLG
jgi:tRNA (guanine-N7-)-methyltransferase